MTVDTPAQVASSGGDSVSDLSIDISPKTVQLMSRRTRHNFILAVTPSSERGNKYVDIKR